MSSNDFPVYNVTGWGHESYSVPLDRQKEVAEYSAQHGCQAAGRRFGIAFSTAWRIQKLYESPSLNPLRDNGDFNKDFRMRACRLAEKHGAKTAALLMGCSTSSVYNWLKAYKMTSAYFNPKAT